MIEKLKTELDRINKGCGKPTIQNLGVGWRICGKDDFCEECQKEKETLKKVSLMWADEMLKRNLKEMDVLVHLEGYLSQVLDEIHKTELEKLHNLNVENSKLFGNIQEIKSLMEKE